MRVKSSMWVQAGVLLGLVGIGAGMVLINPRERHSAKPLTRRAPPTHAVYVWQHKWSPEVVTGIQKASRATTAFMVLGAEITFDKGEPRYRMPDVCWDALAATTKPVWVVLRIHELPEIRRAEQRNASAVLLADVARTLLHEMARFGIQASGVQLDYDCAAEDLAEYASLLRMFREDLPNVSVSLTALPSWLNQPDVPGALAEVDHYVLQVHSIETPGHIDDPIKLCDTARVPGWLQHAVALGFPFLLALPTYGYRLNFAPGGEFLGLVAEDSQEARVGCTTREIMADPVEIASLVCALRSEPPAHLLGFAWFRLPVQGDRLNWSWPVLEKVMQGQMYKLDVRTGVRSPSPHLHEVWVKNEGDISPGEPIHIRVDWINGSLVAHDALAGFGFSPVSGDAGELIGRAPLPGEECMAAWFRLDPADGETVPVLRARAVEVLK